MYDVHWITLSATGTENHLLWEADVDKEELCEVTEHRAVQGAGGRAVEEAAGPEPGGERGQVLVGELPDGGGLLPAHPRHEVPQPGGVRLEHAPVLDGFLRSEIFS